MASKVKNIDTIAKPEFSPEPYVALNPIYEQKMELKSKMRQNKIKNSETEKFKCDCCGTEYDTQLGNFYKSQSTLYKANNNYIHVCNNCIDSLIEQYTDSLGTEEKAIQRICLHFDLYFSKDMLDKSLYDTNSNLKRMQSYVRECNNKKNLGKTYDTFLAESEGQDKSVDEEVSRLLAEIQIQKERWGDGIYNKKELHQLDTHYRLLKSNNPNADGNQEVFIKDLCILNLLKTEMIKQGDTKSMLDVSKAYRDTFKQSGLQLVSENFTDDSLGVNLEVISKYTPEEYYKDKTLYKDFDGIEEYFKRLILRPIQNLFFGTKDKDPEYHVKIEESRNETV